METKEVKIVPPEGYEIDSELSTLECIKFRPITKRWRDNYSKSISGYVIDINSIIHKRNNVTNGSSNYNLFATKKQAKRALAMAQISQIMANDERFGGIITDEEWKNPDIRKYCIGRFADKLGYDLYVTTHHFLAFHTKEQCELFLRENEDLIVDYLMVD